jgi:predicted methyltransferase
LSFFGVRPSDTVVEIWPGGGWYTEILAPYLASGGGRLLLATPDGQLGGVTKLQQANPALYGSLTAATFPAFDAGAARVPDGSADVVLTFRNVHNWRMGYQRPDKQDYSADAFRQIYAMLKPGGVLGIEDHRLPESASDERERTSGYIKVSTVRRLAEAAGFQLAATSEINANPKDTADWPDGVWTLPPSLRLKDQDRERYLAIGESDRMTLKFVKPR